MSLQDLEGSDWGDPQTAETPMIGKVLALRRKPLSDLTVGELRLAIGQKVGLPFILDMAIEQLQVAPLVMGDFYPGDLLASLVRLDEEDWKGRTDLRSELAVLFRIVMQRADEEAEEFREALELPRKGHEAN